MEHKQKEAKEHKSRRAEDDKRSAERPVRPMPAYWQDRVIQLAQKEVYVSGETHLVKMVEGSIFGGEEETFVTHGMRIVIDDAETVLSRRGPDFLKWKDEYETGEQEYEWVRVLAVERVPVEEDGIFIREDAYTEEPPLHPGMGGIQPRMKLRDKIEPPLGKQGRLYQEKDRPILGRYMDGIATGTDVITPEERTLNRLANALRITQEGHSSEITPHVAIMAWNGKIYIAGNSDRQRLQVDDHLLDKVEEKAKGAPEMVRKRQKISRKLRALLAENYHAEEYQHGDEILDAVRNAIENPEDNIVIVEDEEQQEATQQQEAAQHTKESLCTHGEMLILDKIYADFKAGGGGGHVPGEKRTRRRKVFMGGFLQDCLFCHWAFEIFNETKGYEMGIIVVTSGGHGHAPRNWKIPKWLIQDQEAMKMLADRLNELRQRLGLKKGNRFTIQGDKVVNPGEGTMGNDTRLDESESDVE